MGKEQNKSNTANIAENNQCFVIMPISDPEGYEKGHFRYVYEDLFRPAIEKAGFEPKRADDDTSSSMIQVNIIRDIIESPMAICDLSSTNPNVLFELGIRQAFDLPVVLVQEEDTPRIFDINTINTIDYRSSLIYREVIEDRKRIFEAIRKTKDNKTGINSIIRLLEIGKAELGKNKGRTELDDIRLLLYSLSNQIKDLKKKDDILGVPTATSTINNFVQNEAFQEHKNNFMHLRHLLKQCTSKENISSLKKAVWSEFRACQRDERLLGSQKSLLKSEYIDLTDRLDQKLLELENN